MHIRFFKLQLNEGQAEEYERRHNEIWPELLELLYDSGVVEYRIFLNECDYSLCCFMKYKSNNMLNNLPFSPIMQRWWAYMSDIMQTHSDFTPVSTELRSIFTLSRKNIHATLPQEHFEEKEF